MSHFAEAEFLCKCGRAECDAPKQPHRLLLLYLDRMREMYGSPLVVTSGNRCAFWNEHEGGVKDSEHQRPDGCEGADLACGSSRERWKMLDAARHAGFVRIGIGKNFLHVGVGSRDNDVQDVVWVYYT